MYFRLIIVLLTSLSCVKCWISLNVQKNNYSDEAIALSEIIRALNPTCLAILAINDSTNGIVDDFLFQIHKLHYKTCIFFSKANYFEFIENSINASIESSSLILVEPFEITDEIYKRNLAHRLNLFMFYWGAAKPTLSKILRFKEPVRAVVITRPRSKAFRIFYSQAMSIGGSNLHLVNWYDSESLGLYKTPLLPNAATVYSNFHGRIFRVPVIHSPPWFFVSNSSDDMRDLNNTKLKVLGGRDHQLLKLLAEKMNFRFKYIDPPERTQGSSVGDKNNFFTGAIGMIQNQEADILLGDVSLSWERRKVVEFSFFTLADSGTFVTHAPRKLNEALALLRPFKLNVWPFLILTILLSGPALYLVIIIPYNWNFHKRTNDTIYAEYINEITNSMKKPKAQSLETKDKRIPKKMLEKCIWYSFKLFLKQAGLEPYYGYRVQFLTIVYWIGATYVLAAVYSAQLTSQFARPAREAPIDNLFNLEKAMQYRNYKLFVERDSASMEILENSTEIFRRLNKLMKNQNPKFGANGHLVDSIEQGIELISDCSKNVILGGRETLYFNIKRYDLKNVQMSYKLYTRYSAVVVQIGCPYLDSLNDVLMHAFEGGILDKITNNEYEKMSQVKNDQELKENVIGDKRNDQRTIQKHDEDTEPLNMRMLQGAFIILILGYITAGSVLILEITFKKRRIWIFSAFRRILRNFNRSVAGMFITIVNITKNQVL